MKVEPTLDTVGNSMSESPRLFTAGHRAWGLRGNDVKKIRRRPVIADVSNPGERASDKFSEMAEMLYARSRDWIPALRNHRTIYRRNVMCPSAALTLFCER